MDQQPVIASVVNDSYTFTMYDFLQLSPVFISVFMLMTSLFNKDFKGFIWLMCSIVGIVIMMGINTIFLSDQVCPSTINNTIPFFSKYQSLSLSSFFIMFTLFYLMAPMHYNNDWNYYAIFGFLILFGVDAFTKYTYFCITLVGIFSGSVLGMFFGIMWFFIIKSAGGDKLLYYNTSSSNNIYCSKPKKQQFKCNVYKNGEIISSL
jgi:hypothetical protein